jgi:O-antigen ligase
VTVTTTPLRLAAWVGIGCLIFYLAFLGGGWVGIYATQIRTMSAVLAGAAIAGWAAAALRDRSWLPRSRLLPAFGIALLAFVVGLALSRVPRLGLEYLAWSVVLVALYLLFVRLLAHDWFRPRVMSVIVFVTVLHGLAYVGQTVTDWLNWWQVVGEITTPPLRPKFGGLLLGNPSAVMTVQLLLTLPCVVWVGWSSAGRRLGAAFLVGLAMFAIVISASRSGWLALAGAITLVVAIWFARGGRREWIRERLSQPGVRALAIAALGVAAVAAVTLGPGIMFRATEGGEGTRLAFYSASVRMFADEPIHGMGPGMWPVLRAAYTDPAQPNQYIPHAHNLVLHTVAEFGLLGVVAGAVAIALLLRLIWARLSDPAERVRGMAWAALLGTLYFGAHQLLDFYANMPTALFAFAIPIAYLDGTTTARPPTARPTLHRWSALVGGLAVAIAIGGLLLVEGIAVRVDQAVNLANDGEWEAAMAPALDGVSADPGIPGYQFALATIARHNGRHDIALDAYRRAAEVDDLPAAWLGVAVEQQERGLDDEARRSLERAIRLGRYQPALNVAAADLFLRLGDESAAIDQLAVAVAAMPSLAGDEAWTTDERLAALRERVLELARSRMNATQRTWLGLALGDFDNARLAAGEIEDPSGVLMQFVVDGWQGDRGALDQLIDRSRARPLDVGGVALAATLAAHLGETERAKDLRLWADTVLGLYSLRTYTVEFAEPETLPEDLFGQTTTVYGHYTYRRPGPVDQIPAGLLKVAMQ